MATDDGCVADQEEDGAPGDQVGDDEEGAGEEGEVEVECRREDFVGEVCRWRYQLDGGIVHIGEVSHAVL